MVNRDPFVVLDGAHNPMKASALAETLRQSYKDRRIRFLFAAKRDKNIGRMLQILSPLSAKFYFTNFSMGTDFGDRMSYPPEQIAEMTDEKSVVVQDPIKAYERAISETGKDEVLCITGSLYLVGEMRTCISKRASR